MSDQELVIERLLVGASASIGITNLIGYINALRTLGVVKEVQVIMTQTAARMIPPSTVEMYTKNKVFTDLIEEGTGRTLHIDLADWADFFLILPATADLLAKAAAGAAPDLLTTAIIASTSPVAFVPNMNDIMFHKPAVQRNICQLREDGYHVIDPEKQRVIQVSTGEQKEGYSIPSPQSLAQSIRRIYREFVESQTD